MSVGELPEPHGASRLRFLIPAIAAPLVVALAASGSMLDACLLALLAAGLTRVSGRTIDVRVLVATLVLAAFFMPDRYELAASLPINLEPYRILFGLIALVWLVVLLTNPRAHFHRTVIDIPLLLIAASGALSVVVNPERANHFDTNVIKTLLLFATYILLVYVICSSFPRLEDIHWLISVIVAAGTLLAALAVIESATGYNAFNELHRVGWLSEIPGKFDGGSGRGGVTRAFASSSHPIALGVVLAMLFPLAGYLAQQRRVWLVSVILLPAGVLGTVSRTPIVMLIVIVLVLAALRPAEAMRLLAVVGVSASILFLASPGAVGGVASSFFPEGGILAEQSNTDAFDNQNARGRLADLDPVFREWSSEPVFGEGFGTRPVDGRENSLGDGRYSGVLDNQWLDLLLETGVLGVVAWFSTFFVLATRLTRRARTRDDTGNLSVALLTSLVGFAVAMLFLDAFGFPQLIFVAFLIMGIAANVVRQTYVLDAAPVRPRLWL